MKEGRVLVRLISLWVIFVLSLVFSAWSVGYLVSSTVTVATKGYSVSYNYDSYNDEASCIQAPDYPSDSSVGDKASMDKYTQDNAAYKAEYRSKCEAGLAEQKAGYDKEETTQENKDRSDAIGHMISDLIMSIFGIVAAFTSCKEIKKGEQIS